MSGTIPDVVSDVKSDEIISCGNRILLMHSLRMLSPPYIIQNRARFAQARTVRDETLDQSSGVHIRQAQFSAKFFSALFHAANPHPDTVGFKVYNLFTDSFAIVSYRNYEHSIFLRQTDPHLVRPGMPENV